jgi:hypothetical protein
VSRCGAGQRSVTDFTLREWVKSNRGGTPESPGYRQYVFHPGASLISTPARWTVASAVPRWLPAIRRTAARSAPSHGDASAASAGRETVNKTTRFAQKISAVGGRCVMGDMKRI